MVASSPRRTWRDIPGWFSRLDHAVFEAVLRSQANGPTGDLVEIGVFKGKSAVVIGEHLREGERFVVVDPFGDRVLLGIEEEGSRRPGRNYFTSLDRSTFEENYLSVHEELPVVVQALSSEVVQHVSPGSVRFLHVDGSHEYDDVVVDARSARTMLRGDGVVVFDDYRKEAAPGVAAAVWGSVDRDGLIPVAVTGRKLYGTYGDPAPLAAAVRSLAGSGFVIHEHHLGARALLRVEAKPKPKPKPVAPVAPSVATRTDFPARARRTASRVVGRLRPQR